MAKRIEAQSLFISKSKKRRKHSKKASDNKHSKNYKKAYNKQGR